MLTGKTVILGVTGSIAAYKIANLSSMLVKQHCEVHVIMTNNATKFISPMTFETLTKNPCIVDTFDCNFQFDVHHISLAKKADMMMIAPASANVIGKIAHGIGDDMLTTTVLACRKPIVIAPAMNTNMYQNPIVQDNMNTLKKYGMTIIEPASGMLACREIGIGKLPEEELLMEYIIKTIAYKKDLLNKSVLVTAGPTRERIDPVRYIGNHSTGKMGYALARMAMLRGAKVTLVTGKTSLSPLHFVETIPVLTAEDMYDQVVERAKQQDIIIMAAAVADYKPLKVESEKIKKSDQDISLALTRTKDILSYLGEHREKGQILCGFSMETKQLLERSRRKLVSKKLDMIVANDLNVEGAGFGTDTNVVTIMTKEYQKPLERMSKEAVANVIFDCIGEL